MGEATPKTNQLTHHRARELLRYDPETGELRWRVTRPGCKAGELAGTMTSDGYRQIEIDGVFYRSHRLAWLVVTGRWPRSMMDHINGVRHDNSWSNLREATPSENARNRRPCRRNRSGHVGVYQSRRADTWHARIGLDGRQRNLGTFKSKEDAVSARQAAERRYWGRWAPSWKRCDG